MGPDMEYLTEDDDSGGGSSGYDSRIDFVLPEDGTYFINRWFATVEMIPT